MFDATMDLITQATSNSLFIFCFCNLIIAILLIGSLKPSSYDDQENAFPISMVTNVEKNDNKVTANTEGLFKESKVLMDANGVSDAEKGVLVEANKEDDSEEEEDDDEEEEEEEEGDDDELRRRVEEFIEKINRGWRAEMLRTASLVQTENFQTRPIKIHAV